MKKNQLVITLFSILTSFFIVYDAASETAKIESIINEMKEIENVLKQKNVVFDIDSVKTATLKSFIETIDPDAAILTEEQATRIDEENQGFFYGIGITLGIKDDFPIIIEIVEGSPAVETDLIAGELIEKINGCDTKEMPLENIINLLRGPKDEVVEITVRGMDENAETRMIKMKRDIVKIPGTGTMEEWPKSIGYIKVNGLYENSGEQIVTQLEMWMEKEYSGAILDLREAGGMDLDSVVTIAEMFANPGEELFVVSDSRKIKSVNYLAEASGKISIPLIVLINQGSSGATETLAAVLKNRKGVLLVGSATYGDNRIREAMPLSSGKMLYMATSSINLPKQPSYRDQGVVPDIFITSSDIIQVVEPFDNKNEHLLLGLSEDERDNRALMTRVANDPTLNRAIDILIGIKALAIQIK